MRNAPFRAALVNAKPVACRRLFVGIALDAPTREALAKLSCALESAGLTARYELAEKLHVTLAFLGSVAEDRIAPLTEALRGAVSGIEPFTVGFDVLGGFPKNSRTRIAWVGARKPVAGFARLADAVRDTARAFAKLDEKPAVLHVTLARLREPAALPSVSVKASTMRVAEVVLFESLPAGPTSRYEVVARFPLTVHASSPDASK